MKKVFLFFAAAGLVTTVRAQNKGWRNDYISTTENLKERIVDAKIFPDIQHSDHCPIYMELK